MAVHQENAAPIGRCPKCSNEIIYEFQAWSCEECGHVPNHAAD